MFLKDLDGDGKLITSKKAGKGNIILAATKTGIGNTAVSNTMCIEVPMVWAQFI